jgi:hypothetical protein
LIDLWSFGRLSCAELFQGNLLLLSARRNGQPGPKKGAQAPSEEKEMYHSQFRPVERGRRLVSKQQFTQQNQNSMTDRSAALCWPSSLLMPLRKSRQIVLTLFAGSAIVALSGCGGLVLNGSGAFPRGSGTSTSTVDLSQVSCGTQGLTGAQSKACSVYLTSAASTEVLVQLTSSNPALKVPAVVTVPTGALSTGFDAVASAVSNAVTVTITGTVGSVSKTAAITLYPTQTQTAPVTLSKVSCGTTSLAGPTTKACSVYLSGAAGSDTVVNLSSNNAALQVQPSVTVAAGSSTAGFGVTALLVSTPQSATLTASADGVSQTETIQLVGSSTQTSSSHQVNLSWVAPNSTSDPVVGYNVYRSVSGSGFQLLNSTVDTRTSYTDITVQSGTTYDYLVRSVDSSGNESAPSNSTTVTIP